MSLNVRDESVLVYWFLPFSFWSLYPHLLIERECSESCEREVIGFVRTMDDHDE
jgi:hypothetical protein